MSRPCFRDIRFWLLLAALLSFIAALTLPTARERRNSYNLLFTVDITGSMNTRDYTLDGQPVSRLAYVRTLLKQMLANLPCRSRVSLALFTDRRVFLLFNPIEVCANFAPIEGAISALDWREGWEGDSHIAEGLYRAIALAHDLGTDLVFMTDGQEAPPLPWSGGPDFGGRKGAVRGLITGVGSYTLSPIPKYDDNDRQIGFYGEDDVLQESRFGLPPPNAAERPGYNPRNAPFGNMHVNNHEHLSSVREPYLKSLARKTGLGYTHLDDLPALLSALKAYATPHHVIVGVSRGPVAAAVGFACLAAVYLFLPLFYWFRAHVIRRQPRLRLVRNMQS